MQSNSSEGQHLSFQQLQRWQSIDILILATEQSFARTPFLHRLGAKSWLDLVGQRPSKVSDLQVISIAHSPKNIFTLFEIVLNFPRVLSKLRTYFGHMASGICVFTRCPFDSVGRRVRCGIQSRRFYRSAGANMSHASSLVDFDS